MSFNIDVSIYLYKQSEHFLFGYLKFMFVHFKYTYINILCEQTNLTSFNVDVLDIYQHTKWTSLI